MGLKTEGIIFLILAWGFILAVAGYLLTKILPLQKIKKNSLDFIRKWSVE